MLSRFMRHPAGLMRKALGGRFLPGPARIPEASAEPSAYPLYWPHRYSKMGLTLLAPVHPAPRPSPVALVHALRPEAADLPAQAGKASSFLSAARNPAARA